MNEINKIKLPNNVTYELRDNEAARIYLQSTQPEVSNGNFWGWASMLKYKNNLGNWINIARLDANDKIPSENLPTILPAVTTSDNGDFLCVVNGAWAKKTVPDASNMSF